MPRVTIPVTLNLDQSLVLPHHDLTYEVMLADSAIGEIHFQPGRGYMYRVSGENRYRENFQPDPECATQMLWYAWLEKHHRIRGD